ncbi:hypothetical protein I7Q67_08335 [Neisseria meningitidis]|nr:hypothetical protein [Neisseria meningitidis]
MKENLEKILMKDKEAAIALYEEAENDKENILGFREMFLDSTETLIREGKKILEQDNLSEDLREYYQTITAFYEQQLEQFNATA